jgi:sulfur transfer complex TusBCD TusB component (DsrH family)
MLFLVNKTRPKLIELIGLLSGDDDQKEVLLFGDAVFYGVDRMARGFHEIGVRRLYVSKPCLASRSVRLSSLCMPLDYEEMVALIMEEHDKIVSV